MKETTITAPAPAVYPFRFVSRRKLEKILDCSTSFVDACMRKGILKPKYIGRKPYFDLAEVEELIENGA